MPTVLGFRSMRFEIYAGNEHEPPHVHVKLSDGEVVLILDEDTGAITVRGASRSVRAADITRATTIAAEHFEMLLAVWSHHHR